MPPPKTLSEEDLNEIRNLYGKMSAKEVEKKYGIGSPRLYKIWREAGLVSKKSNVQNTNPDPEPIPEPILEPVQIPKTITKQNKSEQGKRLAEWNRKNKEALKQTVLTEKLTEPEKPTEKLTEKTNYTQYFIGGTIIVGGIAIGLIYFIQRGKEIQQETPKQEISKQEINKKYQNKKYQNKMTLLIWIKKNIYLYI